jgi:transcriptional regulator with XRE-family HTH domain
MNIGKVIKSLRKQKSLSQTEFAEKTGITQTSLSMIETGSKRPNPKTLKKICEILEIPEMYLIILSSEEKDVPESKKDLYKELFPIIEHMIKRIWIKENTQTTTK